MGVQKAHTSTDSSAEVLLCSETLVLGLVLDADAVHTVPLVCGCGEALALEDMSQVAAAVGAGDLDAPAGQQQQQGGKTHAR